MPEWDSIWIHEFNLRYCRWF